MSSIAIATIATFIFVAYVCIKFVLFATRTFDAYATQQYNERRNVTNYVGHYYNRHGNQID